MSGIRIYSINIGRGRTRWIYIELIGEVKGGVKGTQPACVHDQMYVDEARKVCKERTKWRSVVFAYLHGKKAQVL